MTIDATPSLPRPSRVLLISGTAPGDSHVGGVILADLIRNLRPDGAVCAWLASNAPIETPTMDGLETIRIDCRFETGYRPLRGITGEVISGFAMRALRPGMLQRCERQVRRVLARTRPTCILAVLNSPAAIQVAARIRRVTETPMVSLVWDDVELLCDQHYLDRWTRTWVGDDLAHVLRNSQRIAVICENMQREYQARYGVSSFVLRHGVPNADATTMTSPPREKRGHWLIGMAGSISAPECFRSLLDALDQSDWKVAGRGVALRLLGVRCLLDSRRPQQIEFLGWRTTDETRRLLEACDLLYLPQPFDEALRTLSTLSFPTKLSTYVAARRPVLLHAPEYASLAEFWKRHQLGPWCATLKPSDIRDALTAALADDGTRTSQWLKEIGNVHDGILSVDEFRRGVHQLTEVRNHEPQELEGRAKRPESTFASADKATTMSAWRRSR